MTLYKLDKLSRKAMVGDNNSNS